MNAVQFCRLTCRGQRVSYTKHRNSPVCGNTGISGHFNAEFLEICGMYIKYKDVSVRQLNYLVF